MGLLKNIFQKSAPTPAQLGKKIVNELQWKKCSGEKIAAWIAQGADLSVCDNSGETALIRAVISDRPEFVRQLLDGGAKVDGHSTRGRTALHYASEVNLAHMVKTLIDAGADVNGRARLSGDTPLICSAGHVRETPEILLSAGADVNAANNTGITALMTAAKAGNRYAVDVLVDAGADTLLRDRDGYHAAAHAYKNSHPNLARLIEAAPEAQRCRAEEKLREEQARDAYYAAGMPLTKSITVTPLECRARRGFRGA